MMCERNLVNESLPDPFRVALILKAIMPLRENSGLAMQETTVITVLKSVFLNCHRFQINPQLFTVHAVFSTYLEKTCCG